jgi:hypothetical protein
MCLGDCLPTDPRPALLASAFTIFERRNAISCSRLSLKHFRARGKALLSEGKPCRRTPIRDEIFICLKIKLSISARGGILDEYGEDEDEPVTSFRYFV